MKLKRLWRAASKNKPSRPPTTTTARISSITHCSGLHRKSGNPLKHIFCSNIDIAILFLPKHSPVVCERGCVYFCFIHFHYCTTSPFQRSILTRVFALFLLCFFLPLTVGSTYFVRCYQMHFGATGKPKVCVCVCVCV